MDQLEQHPKIPQANASKINTITYNHRSQDEVKKCNERENSISHTYFHLTKKKLYKQKEKAGQDNEATNIMLSNMVNNKVHNISEDVKRKMIVGLGTWKLSLKRKEE